MEIYKTLSITLVFAAVFFSLIFVFAHTYLWLQRRRRLFMPFTEDMLPPPGYSIRKVIEEKNDDFAILFVLGFISIGIGVSLGFRFSDHIAPVLLVASLSSWLLGSKLFKLGNELGNYRLGLLGEEYTGQELNFLMRDNAFVFHDMEYKYGNIDHIIVAPGVIFTVETKAYRQPQKERSDGREDIVKYDGETLKFPRYKTSKPIDQAALHAKHIKQLIKDNFECTNYPVRAVVALPGWTVKRPKGLLTDVWVIEPKRARYLRDYICSVAEHPLQKEVAKFIASETRTVSLRKSNTDPTASNHHDLFFRPKEAKDL